MLNFVNHSSFEKELKEICKKYRGGGEAGFNQLKKLLNKQFSLVDRELVIGPGKIHRVTDFIDFGGELWKVEMSVAGLRPNQWPRVWFLLLNNVIYFLHINTHQDNYKDKEATILAKKRVSEFNF